MSDQVVLLYKVCWLNGTCDLIPAYVAQAWEALEIP